jgi:hypothetical protein
VIRIHHWLVDGIGTFHIANRFFELFSTGEAVPAFGNEWKSLPPSLRETVNDESPTAEEEATNMFMNFAANLPSIGLQIPPQSSHQTIPRLALSSRLEFTPERFTAILRACKEYNLSLTPAIHASIVVVTQQMQPPPTTGKNFTTFTMFNYRPYMPVPYNEVSSWPMGNYMLGLPTSLPAADFLTQATALQKVYKQPEFPPLDRYDQYVAKMAMALSAPPLQGVPMDSTPSLSGLGNADGRLQSLYEGAKGPQVRVEDVELRTSVLTPSIAMYQWSWEGKLMISACYNEAFYEPEFVKFFLSRVEDVLLKGLGIAGVR